MQSGKIVTIGIILLGLLATAVSWWHQRQSGIQCLQYYGSQDAFQLRHAEQVELYRLGPPDSAVASGQLEVDGAAWQVLERQPLAKAPGLVHARQSLIVDASYDWSPATAAPAVWEYALRFGDGPTAVTLLFDLQHSLVRSLRSQRRLVLTMADGFRVFFEENLSAVAPTPTPHR